MSRSALASSSITAALALVGAILLACGGRTADLGDAGSSSGGGSGGSGSSGSSGGSPFHGPGCMVSDACWSCVSNACPGVSCLTTDCSAYVSCDCACNPGDSQCQGSCQSSLTSTCTTCIEQLSMCSGVQSCNSVCGGGTGMGGGGMGGSGGSGGSGGGFGSSSSGGETVTSCSGSGQCSNGLSLQSCQVQTNGVCTEAYYTLGSQTIPCASCTDTTDCTMQAKMACQ